MYLSELIVHVHISVYQVCQVKVISVAAWQSHMIFSSYDTLQSLPISLPKQHLCVTVTHCLGGWTCMQAHQQKTSWVDWCGFRCPVPLWPQSVNMISSFYCALGLASPRNHGGSLYIHAQENIHLQIHTYLIFGRQLHKADHCCESPTQWLCQQQWRWLYFNGWCLNPSLGVCVFSRYFLILFFYIDHYMHFK